ncbi:MAG: hypothetical protein CVV44_20460 [Spirochaetae bacterium HGW-Spirochaetae-1]|jgi:hypothetical protein|nr:MAG: hypothetical protein CVV44_20460 [Spirochaetae bacterium HGW-Spirochaetae-1]
MVKTLTEIFTESGTIDDFRKNVMQHEGRFPFDVDDMTGLGNAYLKRYPDSFENRNSEHVLLGYELVRICITEKLVASCEEKIQAKIRKMFGSIPCIDPCAKELISDMGYEASCMVLGEMSRVLDDIKFTIETMKPGVVKERYIGGISKFYNIIYLLKMSMEKYK